MSRRWSPPGNGWIRVVDCGDLAVWMRPDPDGVSVAVYTGNGFGNLYGTGRAQTWIARLPRGSALPWHVLDKPHRIRWAFPAGLGPFGAYSVSVLGVPASHRGHRRLNWNRRVWCHSLPPRVLRALDPVAAGRGDPVGWLTAAVGRSTKTQTDQR